MKDQILQMMIDEGMGINDLCTQCRSSSGPLTNALGPWITCDRRFGAESVLFVGKVARGDNLGDEITDNLEDVTPFGVDFISESSWPYWAYTRDIIERVFGDLPTGIKRMSFTNIVKCNSGTTQDTTGGTIKEFCVGKNRFIWKELELIKPRLAIFYTGYAYDDYLAGYLPAYARSFIDNEDRKHVVTIGEKTMPWWDRSYYDKRNTEVLRLLRVGHPERKKREDFVQVIAAWMSAHLPITLGG